MTLTPTVVLSGLTLIMAKRIGKKVPKLYNFEFRIRFLHDAPSRTLNVSEGKRTHIPSLQTGVRVLCGGVHSPLATVQW